MPDRTIMFFTQQLCAQDALMFVEATLDMGRDSYFYTDYEVQDEVCLFDFDTESEQAKEIHEAWQKMLEQEDRLRTQDCVYRTKGASTAPVTMPSSPYTEPRLEDAGYLTSRKIWAGKMVKLYDILGEHFCADMPFFNLYTYSYALPSAQEGENKWYVVKADLKY